MRISSSVNPKSSPRRNRWKRISSQSLTIFSRQLATLLSAGIPLAQALKIIHDGMSQSSLKPVIQIIMLDIEKGNSFYYALQKHPKIFDQFYCALVNIGELSGSLETLLMQLTIYKEKIEALIRKIKILMIYPLTVFTVALLMIILLLTQVIPTFKQLFFEFKFELPIFTKILLSCSDWIYQYGIVLSIILLIMISILVICYRKHPHTQLYLHKLFLYCPIMGNLIQYNSLARLCWALSTALSAGIPLTEALNATANTAINRMYAKVLQELKEKILTGDSIHCAMSKTAFFPSLMVQMIGVGEESGKVEELLKKIAMLYEEVFDAKLSGLVALLEPFMMVLLGLIIGALIIGIYLPIFKMGTLF